MMKSSGVLLEVAANNTAITADIMGFALMIMLARNASAAVKTSVH